MERSEPRILGDLCVLAVKDFFGSGLKGRGSPGKTDGGTRPRMTAPLAFQRLTLRAVLRDVSPMVIRVVSVPDDTELTDLHEIFQAILG